MKWSLSNCILYLNQADLYFRNFNKKDPLKNQLESDARQLSLNLKINYSAIICQDFFCPKVREFKNLATDQRIRLGGQKGFFKI